jgi:hypothetical protein
MSSFPSSCFNSRIDIWFLTNFGINIMQLEVTTIFYRLFSFRLYLDRTALNGGMANW